MDQVEAEKNLGAGDLRSKDIQAREAGAEFQPCRACRNDFRMCTCNRQVAFVERRLRCPYCEYDFKTASTGKRAWIQRCGSCWKAFDAVDGPLPDPPEVKQVNTIYKYRLGVGENQTIAMPALAQILTAQMQRDEICIWALVDDEMVLDSRVFDVVGTGQPIRAAGPRVKFVATVQDGPFVWHVFERL